MLSAPIPPSHTSWPRGEGSPQALSTYMSGPSSCLHCSPLQPRLQGDCLGSWIWPGTEVVMVAVSSFLILLQAGREKARRTRQGGTTLPSLLLSPAKLVPRASYLEQGWSSSWTLPSAQLGTVAVGMREFGKGRGCAAKHIGEGRRIFTWLGDLKVPDCCSCSIIWKRGYDHTTKPPLDPLSAFLHFILTKKKNTNTTFTVAICYWRKEKWRTRMHAWHWKESLLCSIHQGNYSPAAPSIRKYLHCGATTHIQWLDELSVSEVNHLSQHWLRPILHCPPDFIKSVPCCLSFNQYSFFISCSCPLYFFNLLSPLTYAQ